MGSPRTPVPAPGWVDGETSIHPPAALATSGVCLRSTIQAMAVGDGRSAHQGGFPGAGERMTVASVVAVVLVHPDPLVAILAFFTVSWFEPL